MSPLSSSVDSCKALAGFPSCFAAAGQSAASRPQVPRPSAPPSEDEALVGVDVGRGATDGDGRAERTRNPFRDVNKIKEPDMIKHEVHHKGNVNLSPDPFIIKNTEPALGCGGTPANL